MSTATARILRAVANQIASATARRDRLIRQRRAEGATWVQIGKEAGLSHTAAAYIGKRSDDG